MPWRGDQTPIRRKRDEKRREARRFASSEVPLRLNQASYYDTPA